MLTVHTGPAWVDDEAISLQNCSTAALTVDLQTYMELVLELDVCTPLA